MDELKVLASKLEGMKQELLRLMEVQLDNDLGWGPDPFVCRWCHCWLRYSDDSRSKPREEHNKDCFAVKYLGRPGKLT